MGNINTIATKATQEEIKHQRALEYFYEQQNRQLAIDKALWDKKMEKIEKDNRKYRTFIRKIIKDNDIPHWEESIIVIKKNGITHVYSRVDWFAPASIRDNCRRIIKDFMKSIGEELVLDQDGNPTNDIEWHFENTKTDYHFILNALNIHGYT